MPMTASAALRSTVAAAASAAVALAAPLPGRPQAAASPGGFSERQSPDRFRFGDCRLLVGPAHAAARAGRSTGLARTGGACRAARAA